MTDNRGPAPPGWYPDPSGAPRQRYFDGELWTDHYHEDAMPTGAAGPGGGYVAQGHPIGLTSAGALLSHAWGAVRALAGPLLGLTIGFGILIAGLYALFFAWIFSRRDNTSFGDAYGDFIFAYIGLMLVAGLVYSAYVLVATRLFHLEHRNHEVSVADAWRTARGRVFPFFGVVIGLYIGFYIGVLIMAFILVAIAPPLIFLIVIPTVYAWVKWGFLPIAAVATRPRESMMSASMSVSEGRFWPVLGRMIFVALPLIAANIATGVFFAIAEQGGSDAGFIVALVFSLLGGVIGGMILMSGLTKLYLDSGARSDI